MELLLALESTFYGILLIGINGLYRFSDSGKENRLMNKL